jgi:glutamate dehydrogenase (NAD(P)+)
MSDWLSMADELGPEKILHVYDPETGMRGVVVVDTMSLAGAGGGTRMLPDISTEEIFGLARAMTYKFAVMDLPIGGSKAGIWGDPAMPRAKKDGILKAFGRAIKPLLEAGVNVASDMGTDDDDVDCMYEGAGIPHRSTGLTKHQIDGEPLENHATGYGVVVAAQAGCEYIGVAMKGASVAIEGFGKAGGGVARYIIEAGARVVALSNIDGTLYNPEGLDIKALLEARRSQGDRALSAYQAAQHLSREAIYTLPVDILIPGARPYVITKDNAEQVRAKIISCIANIPITAEAEAVLFRKNIHAIPDFISNAGGVIVALVDILGGREKDVFHALRAVIRPLTIEILEESKKKGISPRKLAVKQVTEKVLQARARKAAPPPLEELLAIARKRFDL